MTEDGLTVQEYHAQIRALGLRPVSNLSTTYITVNGEPQNVPAASEQTPKQRAETIEWLKECLGIRWRE